MRKNIIFNVVLVLTICIISSRVFAEGLDELLNKQNEIKTQQNEATTQLEGVKEELSNNLQQIQELNTNISKYEEEISGLDNQVITLQNSITEIEKKLGIAQENYDKQKQALEERVVAMYEAGNTTYLDFILSSKGITDFISNYYLISEIANYDTQLLDNIEKEKNTIETSRNALDQQKKEYNTIKANKEKTAIILENTKTIKNTYVSQLTEQERQIQDQIDLYQSQINEIESEIMKITMANMDSTYIGGIMAWPVPGYTRITSSFGMRTHPITGIYKLHTGVDIAGAPVGADFVAANDGVVVKAEYNSAYGKMVMIDHGGGISTLYAHGSEIVVQLGQTVKKGEVVLKVGSTGYSTGPHAHFEVRQNGTPVDPMPYITSKDEKMEE